MVVVCVFGWWGWWGVQFGKLCSWRRCRCSRPISLPLVVHQKYKSRDNRHGKQVRRKRPSPPHPSQKSNSQHLAATYKATPRMPKKYAKNHAQESCPSMPEKHAQESCPGIMPKQPHSRVQQHGVAAVQPHQVVAVHQADGHLQQGGGDFREYSEDLRIEAWDSRRTRPWRYTRLMGA